MFPEDYVISLEDLVYYGVGLAKFNDLESLNDARGRVQNAVNILTCSGLLLNVNKENKTKMHDVVRDVALLIASEGKSKFLVESKGLTNWLPRYNTYQSYTGISLMRNDIRKLPDYELHLPHLNIFLIPSNNLSTISDDFIGGIKEVKVFNLYWNEISYLPRSFKLLTKLRMLNLSQNKSLCEISILGELKDLEILILSYTGIKEIPQEIGQLVNLRRFDVSSCKNLCHISPGVLSNLCWLEELCIGFSPSHYQGIHDSLVEVMNLSKLTYLDLLVPCFDVIPKGFDSQKLIGFVIQIRQNKFRSSLTSYSISECYLFIVVDIKILFLKRLKKFIEASPKTVLQGIKNLNNILPTLYHEGFNILDSIELIWCPNVACLVETSDSDEMKTEDKFFTKLKNLILRHLWGLEVLWKCPDEYISLCNLVTLNIEHCNKLVRVFSVSLAQGLVSLQELTIVCCKILEEVIWGTDDEETDDRTGETANIIVFPSLSKISFEKLDGLQSFCCGNFTFKYPSLVQVNIKYCSSFEKWGNGIQETPKLKFVDEVPLDGPYDINHAALKASLFI